MPAPATPDRLVKEGGGKVWQIRNGQARHVQNTDIVDCISRELGIGPPVPVDYPPTHDLEEGGPGFCPYRVFFVRETSSGRLFLIKAGEPVRFAATSDCSRYYADDGRMRTLPVKDGETKGHRIDYGYTFTPSPQSCAGLLN
jgi:hypothetical protein